MKVFAVVPALLILVSLCGSPVPAPPGVVTGTVFFDANRNGIRDSCDSPMKNAQLVVNGPEGTSGIARTNDKGEFKIEDAPVGDGTVTLFTGADQVWPITTKPVTIGVASLKATTGVEIGSASKSTYDATITSIRGIIFDDKNGNGEVDVDECPVSDVIGLDIRAGDRIAVVRQDGTYEISNLPRNYDGAITASLIQFGVPFSSRAGGRLLRATNGEATDDSCTNRFSATPRYGALINEANLGYTLARGDGSVTGVVFEDTNGNSVQDAGEAGLAGVWLSAVPSSACRLYDTERAAGTDEDGSFTIEGLYPVTYVVLIDRNPYGPNRDQYVTLRNDPEPFTLQSGQRLTQSLAVKIGPPGSLQILVFDDDNGNGVRDPGEVGISEVKVCASPEGPPENSAFSYTGRQGPCGITESEGTTLMADLPEGKYTVSENEQAIGQVSTPYTATVRVTGGEEARLDYPIQRLTASEQVVPQGEGSSLNPDFCYSNPNWVQPDFDSVWDDSQSFATGYDKATSRLVYSHGIYLVKSLETATWSVISGTDLNSTLAGCVGKPGWIFLLSGYEPIEVVQNDKVSQVRLMKRGSGLYVLRLPETPPVRLFVDEGYAPIARCSGMCEWNDGTPPGDPTFNRGY